MLEPQLLIPGYTPDPGNPNTGFLTNACGQPERVYLKRSRTLERQATESAALALLQQQPGSLPVPRVIAEFQDGSGPVLALSYEAGVNLADLLSPSPAAPPRPPWYQPSPLPALPSIAELAPLLSEVGRAVRAMHAVRVGKFGKLNEQGPNPHSRDARAFTYQEFMYRIHLAVEKGFLSSPLLEAVEQWVSREIGCLVSAEPPCFTHYDLHAGNVRVYADPLTGAWRLRSIFDFELARGWLPEWDLAAMQSDLQYLEGDAGLAWHSFLDGYGPVDPTRLGLFECLRAVSAIAYSERYPLWAAWSRAALVRLLDAPGLAG